MNNDYAVESQYETESDSDLDLPTVPSRGRASVKKDAWHLSQGKKNKSTEMFGGSTDNSELEDFVEDRARDDTRRDFDLSTYGENANVQVKSLNPVTSKGRAGLAPVPKIVESLLPSTCPTNQDSLSDESGDEMTEDENLEVNLADYKFIMNQEIISRGSNLELRSYETLITSRSANLNVRRSNYDEDTSEGDISDMADADRKPRRKTAKKAMMGKSPNLDSGNDSTDASDIEVSMRDYYTIRHENDCGDRQGRRLSLSEALNSIKFNPRFAHSVLRSLSPGPDTDEESICSDTERPKKAASKATWFHQRQLSSSDSEDDEDLTHCSDLNVTMKDYYAIRHQTAPRSDGMNEFILEMNSVESRIVVNDEDRDYREDSEYNDDTDDTEDENFELSNADDMRPLKVTHRRSAARSRRGQKKLSIPDTDQEDISCAEADLMTVDEFLHAFRNDYDMMASGNEPAVTQVRSTRNASIVDEDNGREEEHSENETLSVTRNEDGDGDTDNEDEASVNDTEMERLHSDTMTVEDLVPRARPLRLQESAEIRMVERDGLVGSVGIIVSNPMSPTADNVFGIRFMPPQPRERGNRQLAHYLLNFFL